MSENRRRSSRIKPQIHPEEYNIKAKTHRQEYDESTDSTSPKKLKPINHDFIKSKADAIEEELKDIEQNNEKPTELYLDNDVDASCMYSFTNTTKKNAMIEKAAMCRSLPSMLKAQVCISKLPNNEYIRGKGNKKSEKISESDAEQEEASDENSNCDKINSNSNEKAIIEAPSKLRSGRTRSTKGYYLESEEYFAKQSEKSVTSNHTLSKLKNKQLDEKQLQKLLASNDHISKNHKEKIQLFSQSLEARYEEWIHIMQEGFTVLLYGLGSKRLLINKFRKTIIADEPTLVINGFFPSLTIKEILDNIIVELLGLETVSNQSECFDIIKKTMQTYANDRIYLLVHNLDGGMLRSSKAQDMLSRLASIPNIHMLASVDHINAPLIWDNVKRTKYNFYWMDATTFLPYEAETTYESSLLVQKSGTLALLSLQNVFASLTSNAKYIYILLVKYQLKNSGNNYTGMAFKELYRASREAFVVSSDQALRSQLTEFIDHKLVRNKRNLDGAEYLIIPLDDALLKQFLQQQEEAE